MRKTILILLTIIVIIEILAYNKQILLEMWTSKEVVEFAKKYLALFQKRDFDTIEKNIDYYLKDSQLRAKLEQIAMLFPKENPIEITLEEVEVVWSTNKKDQQTELIFLYKFSEKLLLARIILQKDNDKFIVNGIDVRAQLHVQPLSGLFKNINRLTFYGKSINHYLIFGLAILLPLVVVVALIVCIKTSMLNRKWLWIIFILLFFAHITIDWTTGDVMVTFIGVSWLDMGLLINFDNSIIFSLFGTEFCWDDGFYTLIHISVSVPLGALIFLWRHQKWLVQSVPNRVS